MAPKDWHIYVLRWDLWPHLKSVKSQSGGDHQVFLPLFGLTTFRVAGVIPFRGPSLVGQRSGKGGSFSFADLPNSVNDQI